MNFRSYEIKDICKIKSGKRLPKGTDFSEKPTKHKYIRARDIKNGKIDGSDLGYISEETQKKIERYIVNTNDIIITIAGTIGEVALVSKKFDGVNLTENAVRLTEFSKDVCPEFLAYILKSPERKEYMEQVAGGSAQPKLGIYKIEAIKVDLPDVQIQHKIADILSAYDNLIENNQKQIKLLEEAAQRLYKEWFVDLRFPGHENTKIVDGVPEGWNWCKLEDAIQLDPKVTLTKERMKQFIPMSALSTSSMVLDKSQFTETRSNSGSKFQNGDTLLARITPCLENGKTAYVSGIKSDEGAVGSTEYIVMRAKTINSYMVYLLARTDDFRQSAINSMSGSDGRQRVKSDKLKMLDYLHPTSELVEKFENVEEPIFEKIYRLSKQMQQAKQARDLLLPKLMSGEVEV